MLIYKAFRYRVYPTKEQQGRLGRWNDALRFLWNLALEQRLLGMSRTDKRYPTAVDQSREMTELRRDLPWLADVPRNVSRQMLDELEMAFQRCFKRLNGLPRWKRRGRDVLGLCEPNGRGWRLDGTNIRFPKLGVLRTVMHRPIEGKPRMCTLKRDGDQWFASIVCEIETVDPAPRTAPVIAIDRGVTNLLADSDGHLTTNPRHYDKALKRLARAQRNVSRKQKGSKNREKAKARVMRIHRKVRRQREHFLHVHSTRIAKSHGVVVIERLNVGTMVRARSFSKGVAGAAWSKFARMLQYKLAWSGGTLIEVPAQYSSRTCSACGAIDAASRKREAFNCTACGHTDHADLNAAKILKQRYETPGNPWCLPVEGSALEAARRSRKEKVKQRVPRRSPLKSPASGA